MLKLYLYSIKHDGFIAAESEEDARKYFEAHKNDYPGILSDPETFTSIVGPLTNVHEEFKRDIPWGDQNEKELTCQQILDLERKSNG